MNELIHELQLLHNEIIGIVQALSEQEYQHQYHSDLSPIGWHLGHCTYIESYWIREQLLDMQEQDEILKSQYVPELSTKTSRATALPRKNELLQWAKETQSKNYLLLQNIANDASKHPLLKNNYLLYFLIQHYSQHLETIQMILTEKQIHSLGNNMMASKKLCPAEPNINVIKIKSDFYQLGSKTPGFPYDNEHALQKIELKSFEIARFPVTNAEYLMFMNEGAYSTKNYWSETGWQWITENNITHPHHWRLQENECWVGVNAEGIYALETNEPIHGLNYFEANAYASWAGGRLPHEFEWEVACNRRELQKTNHAWEWCYNTFHPYPGFSPYPYDGYSMPYFDNKHFVLRGGSPYTKKFIKRPTFRNYYEADKRHIFAGVRLAYN